MLSALNGFSKLLPDKSGDYLYYRDFSFSRESYIGILYYDDSSIQIRYFDPEPKSQKLPEKEISILISINPNSQNMELTGELVMSTIIPESSDVDIVNYLHDILYEFSSRRIKEKDISYSNDSFSSKKAFTKIGHNSPQDFKQFGGQVSIIYDDIIPLFNIKSIYSEKDELILACCTFGRLRDNADSSFDNFKGFNYDSVANNKTTAISATSKKTTYTTATHQTITLDENWTQSMENLWLLENESIITITEIPTLSQDIAVNNALIFRKLLESAIGSYTNILECEVTGLSKNKIFKFNQISYQPNTENWIRNKRIITKNGTNFYYFTLTVFENSYRNNKAYYDSIFDSYKIK